MRYLNHQILISALTGTFVLSCAAPTPSPSYPQAAEMQDSGASTAQPAPAQPEPVMTADAPAKAPRAKEKRANQKARNADMSVDLGVPLSPSVSAIAVAPEPEPVPNTEDYTHYRPNPWVETAKDKFSTFSIDVDTASYTISRRKLEEGTLPPVSAVRVEEFINYFKYNYQPPQKEPFAVHLEAAPSPFDASKVLLRVGVQGKVVPKTKRPPVHLTFLVDTSGSMSSADKLGLVKESMKVLVDNLNPGDTVAITTYAGDTRVVLSPTGARQKKKILNAIDDLTSGGGTAMGDGMKLAYKQAMKSFEKGAINRVIVLSDGDANIGQTSHEEILKSIEEYVQKGITMTTVGVGNGNYKDTMMEQLANKGNGNYVYLDSLKAANRFFGEELTGTLQVIAKDVKIQVEFHDDVVTKYRLIGYENRDIADQDFRNDKVDAGEIGAGHSVTAFYELDLVKNPKGPLATVRIRAKQPDGEKAQESAFPFDASQIRASFEKSSSDFQFAAAVIAFAEKLRQNPAVEEWSFDRVKELAKANLNGMEERQEFLALVGRAISLGAR